MSTIYRVSYLNKKGAGVTHTFHSLDDCANYLPKVKCPALVYLNDVEVGEVWKLGGRWVWVIEV